VPCATRHHGVEMPLVSLALPPASRCRRRSDEARERRQGDKVQRWRQALLYLSRLAAATSSASPCASPQAPLRVQARRLRSTSTIAREPRGERAARAPGDVSTASQLARLAPRGRDVVVVVVHDHDHDHENCYYLWQTAFDTAASRALAPAAEKMCETKLHLVRYRSNPTATSR